MFGILGSVYEYAFGKEEEISEEIDLGESSEEIDLGESSEEIDLSESSDEEIDVSEIFEEGRKKFSSVMDELLQNVEKKNKKEAFYKLRLNSYSKTKELRNKEMESILFSMSDLVINPSMKYNKRIRIAENLRLKYTTAKNRKMNMHKHQWQNRRTNRQRNRIVKEASV
jgi:hypothetical protein